MKRKISSLRLVSRRLIIILIILISLGIVFLVIDEAKSKSDDNVYGWAWSENIGWISFNCYNDYGSGMESHCIADGHNSDYGVHIDPITGKFSGYAWAGGGEDTYFGTPAPTIGWISFNRLETGAPPFDDPCPDGSCIAELNLGTYEVSGWARAYRAIEPEGQTLGGWTGWIKLKGIADDSSPYGIQLDIISEEFQDWAWGGGGTNEKAAVIGWISFNCSNTGCPAGNYKVMTDISINPAPSATNLYDDDAGYCIPITLPLSVDGEGGSRSSPPIRLNWTFSDPGDSQNGYMITIDDDSNLEDDPGDETPPRGCPLNQAPYYVDTTAQVGPDYSCHPVALAFGTTYWWRLKVWDSGDRPSGWINAPTTFTTDLRWPNTKFTPDPLDPLVDVEVTFTDESTCSGFPNCNNYPTIKYDWDFGDGIMITDTAAGSPTHIYELSGDYTVRLEVTDGSRMCPFEHPLISRLPLPKWKEIPPF